jgi:hypothetical protein
MFVGDAYVHQGYESHSQPSIFSLKRYCVGMMLPGGTCVHKGYERHSPPNIFSLIRYYVLPSTQWVGMMLEGVPVFIRAMKDTAPLTYPIVKDAR